MTVERDRLCEVISERSLGLRHLVVCAVNVDGFYDGLRTQARGPPLGAVRLSLSLSLSLSLARTRERDPPPRRPARRVVRVCLSFERALDGSRVRHALARPFSAPRQMERAFADGLLYQSPDELLPLFEDSPSALRWCEARCAEAAASPQAKGLAGGAAGCQMPREEEEAEPTHGAEPHGAGAAAPKKGPLAAYARGAIHGGLAAVAVALVVGFVLAGPAARRGVLQGRALRH